MTYSGCIQPQSAYMQAHGGTSTGGARTSAGASTDFVLISAGNAADRSASSSTPSENAAQARTDTPAPATDRYGSQPTVPVEKPADAQTGTHESTTNTAGDLRSDTNATVGTSGSPSAYMLNGHAADLRRLSGKRVEIVGTMNQAARSANSSASGTPNLQSLTVISVREVPGNCNTK
jgi:hypothetical protein